MHAMEETFGNLGNGRRPTLSPMTQAAAAAPQSAIPEHAAPDYTSAELLDAILSCLTDNKAEEIVQIDLHGRTSIGDYMVVASGRSSRQVSALAGILRDTLKAEFGVNAKLEGKEMGDWVLIDTADVIVHLFRPEVREFYQIEKMWTAVS